MLLLATLLWSAFAADAAEVFRWVDDQGRVHFGDRTPVGVKSQVLTVEGIASSGSRSDAGLRGSEVRMLEGIDERPPKRTSSATRTASATPAGNPDDCQQARDDLSEVRERMRAGYRASEYDELQGRASEAKTQIRTLCR